MQILEKLRPLALLALRLGVAAVFLASGYDKLFRAPAKWAAWFPQHGFPFYFSYIAGSLEFFGAILLVLGLLTRFVGLLLTIQMGIALAKVSLPSVGIYNADTYGLPLTLAVACFTLAILGAGFVSVDAATFERKGKSRAKARA
jgi:putative oxidoreductase